MAFKTTPDDTKSLSISVQVVTKGTVVAVYGPPSAQPGNAVTVYGDIRNDGGVSSDFQVKIEVNGSLFERTLTGLAAGSTQRVSQTFTMPNAAVTATFKVFSPA